jgi:prepilin peptidase CpaA
VCVLAAYLGLAAAWDVYDRRIPNRLVGVFTIAALCFAVAGDGAAGLCWAAGGFGVGFGALFVPVALGYIGAGDAKFFGAVGTFLGPQLTAWALLYGTAFGAFAAIPALCRARAPRTGVPVPAQLPNSPASAPALAPDRAASVPYAVPLALGAVTALALR